MACLLEMWHFDNYQVNVLGTGHPVSHGSFGYLALIKRPRTSSYRLGQHVLYIRGGKAWLTMPSLRGGISARFLRCWNRRRRFPKPPSAYSALTILYLVLVPLPIFSSMTGTPDLGAR